MKTTRATATILATFLIAALPAAVHAAGGDIAWQVGDSQPGRQEAMASAIDRQDNLLLTGYSLNASEDFHTVKIKADGSGVAWRATFDRAGGNDRALAVAVDSLGDVIVAGAVSNGINTDFHIIKYCGETRTGANACTGGSVLWQHSLDGAANGNDQAVAVAVDPLDNIYVGGYTQSAAGSDDFMVVKYYAGGPSANGSPAWKVTKDNAGGEDRINAIAANASGVTVTGYSQKTGPADFDMLTVRYGADGSELWQRIYDGGLGDDRGWLVDLATNGAVTVSATSYNGSIKSIYTARYAAADGATVWQRTYSGGNLSEPMALTSDALGDVYLAGVTFTASGKNDFYVVRYQAADGLPLWETIYDSGADNADVPTDIAVDEAGDVFVTGYAHKNAQGDDDFLTLKLKRNNGTVLWASLFNGPGGDDQAVGMAVGVNIASSGDVYIAGWSDRLLAGQSDYDFYAVRYDAGLLNPPTGLNAATVTANSVALSWTDNAGNEDQFVIERCAGIGCANFAAIATVPANTTSHADSTVAANIWYTYRIAATSAAAGSSHYSNAASALTTVMSYAPPFWAFQFNGPENADDRAMAIATGVDNHPVVTGSQLSPALGSGGFDYLTVKIDRTNASEIWRALYNDPDDELDVATCLAIDANNDIIVSGYSSLYGGGGTNTNDLLTLKYASTGPQQYGTPHLWSDQYNGPSGDDDRSTSIDTATDASGNAVVVGYGRNTAYNDDIYVLKYGPTGARLWAATPYNNGGNDYPGDVVFDPAGDILVSGTTWKNGSYDLFLGKYAASDGHLLWIKEYDHAGGDDQLKDLDVDPAGNIYVAGHVTGADGDTDQYVAKFRGSDGALLWAQPVITDGGGNLFDEALIVRYDRRANGIVVGGSVTSATGSIDFSVHRYDSNGILVWAHILDRAESDDIAVAMGMDHDGNVCLAGNTDDNVDTDILAVCYDQAGNLIGSLRYNGTADGDDFAEDVAVNALGEMFIAGATTNAAGNTDYLIIRGDSDVMLSPGNLAATALYSTAALSWRDNTTTENGFHLWRASGACSAHGEWLPLPDLAANQLSFADQNLTPGSSYCYRLQAFANNGKTSPYSEEIAVTTQTPTVTGCTATPSGSTGMVLAWTDQTSNETGFLIERCSGTGCAPGTAVTSLPANSQGYTDTGICNATPTSYRISAVGSGWSASCVIANVSTPAIQTPTIGTVTALSESGVEMTWTDPNTDPTGNRIYRCEGAGCTPPTGSGNALATVARGVSGAAVALDLEETNWAGAGALRDSAGSSNHATASGNAASTTGKNGLGGTFDGTSDFIQWAYSGGRPKDNFTMAAWVKTTLTHQLDAEAATGTTGTSGQRYVFWPDYMGTDSGAGFSVGTNGISVYEHGDGYMPPLAVYSATLPAGWNHIAVTYTNRQPRIYLNGVLVRTGLASTKAAVHAPLVIGGGTYGWWNGQVDEVKVFGRALTANEVKSLHTTTFRSFIDTTAQPGITYRYRATSYKDASCQWESQPTQIGEASTSLANPCPLNAVAATTSSVNMAWTDRFSSETGYAINRCVGAGCGFSTPDATFTAAANQIALTDSSVCAGQTYGYQLTAVRDQAPTWTSAACTATVSLAVAATPGSFTAARFSEQEIRLSWTDATTDETGFEIDRCEGASCDFSTATVIPLAANTTTYNDTGRTIGVTYRYRIRALKTGACGWPSANSATATATASFDPPQSLTARAISSTRIDLAWVDATITETGFAIDRCEGASCDFSTVSTVSVPANSTSYSDTSVCAGITYRYQLRSLDAGSGSSPSVPASATAFAAVVPTGLTVTAGSESVADLVWEDNTVDETGFVIERCDAALAACMADPANMFTALPALPTAAPPAAPAGHTLLLRMNEAAWNGTSGEAKDSSGNNLNGYRVNQAQTVADGINGRAATFDGSADRIEMGNPAQLKITGSQTISFWLKPSNFAVRRSIVSKAYAGEFSITQETNGTLNYYYGTVGNDSGTNFQTFGTVSPLTAGAWTHVAIVRDLTTLKLAWYINGAKVNETAALYPAATAGNNAVRIGDGFAGSYLGLIDELAVFSRALTASEVSGEYNRFMSKVLLHLEDTAFAGAGAAITDDSGLNHHGVTKGAVAAVPGRFGQAAQFNGAADAIELGDIDSLDAPTAFTVSLWFNRTASSTAASTRGINNVLIANSGQTTGDNLEIGTEGGNVEFYLSTQTGIDGAKSVAAGIQDGVWNHLALTYDSLTAGQGAILYLNGAKIGQWTDFAGPLDNTTTSPLTLGMTKPDGTVHANFAGLIDEVMVSGRALSADEIRRQARAWYSDSGLAPGSTHTYRVRAYKDSACGWNSALLTSEAKEVTTTSPALSGDLALTRTGSNRVRLDWTDTTDSESQYIVKRCIGSGCTPEELLRITSDSEWYVDDTVCAAGLYSYQVVATNGVWTAPSNIPSIDITPPAAATGLTITGRSETEVDLAWTDSLTDEDGYRIARCSGTGCTNFVVVGTAAPAASYTHRDTGLTPAAPYEYRVYPYRGTCEWSDLFAAGSAATVITPPTGLAATTVNTTEVTLIWTDTTSSETGFELERCQGASCSFSSPTVFSIAANATTYTDRTAMPGVTYSYRLRPIRTGDPSWPATLYSNTAANVATAGITGAVPAGLAATRISEASLRLNWADNATDENGFTLERSKDNCDFASPTQISIAANAITYTDSDTALVAGSSYCYRIKAYKNDVDPGPANNGWSTEASATASAATTIIAPTAVTATAVNTTRIDLAWTDNTATETGFAVYRCEGASCAPSELVTTTAANAVSYSDVTVCNGRTYTYEIRPQRTGFWLPTVSSLRVEATTQAALAPASFDAQATNVDTIELSWQDGYPDETRFELERCSGANCTTFAPLANPAANTVTYQNTGLNPSQAFCYRLRAVKTGPACGWQTEWSSLCQTSLMPPPAGLTVTALGSMKIAISWTDNSGDENGFVIEEKLDNGRFGVLDLVGANATAYTATIGITGGTTHIYRVRAYRGDDQSLPTGEGQVTTPSWQEGDNTCK